MFSITNVRLHLNLRPANNVMLAAWPFCDGNKQNS